MNTKECTCHAIERLINKENPKCDWNMDKACRAWNRESDKLIDNDIEFGDYEDANYACTCPTCGRVVCGWCI